MKALLEKSSEAITYKRKNINKSKNPKDNSEEKIDEILENITLHHPKSSYTLFCISEAKKLKRMNEKLDLIIISKKCSIAWAKLDDNEKIKYKSLHEKEKLEYKKSIEIVRHYLFKDYNDNIRNLPTAYRIFLNQKLIEGLDKNKDPKK